MVTQGDPAGVGPELLLRLAAEDWLRPGDLVVADPDRLRWLAGELGDWAARGLAVIEPLLDHSLVHGPLVHGPQRHGQVSALVRGVDLVLEDPQGRALVTAPIDKAGCRDEGFAFPGHTEYLAARAGVDDFAMLMVGPRLRVVLATIHIPLREVPLRLDVASIVRAGKLLARALRTHFGRPRPVIGVLGLNPHAGERGLLGDEEITTVAPAVLALNHWAAEDAAAAGYGEPAVFRGPLPADTAFAIHADGQLDGVVAMYHDQGLGPFKLLHMRDGVNMTLGLPFIRTSPDHGTARDIAGRGLVDPSSMFAAVALARGGRPEP
ncbi:MAG: 4-hydroxythreonine-4-phosphate dehydrogenase PdxA [Nannocystis sp.]|nr:4-hydroxythreonine-4-phosphate dehydrogenase PdxA [Nannocystis sp.]MBA3547890.1 4-hydroxythreonine-4-phosphate dehydrogenase PdxA [Nannocystis sp.]